MSNYLDLTSDAVEAAPGLCGEIAASADMPALKLYLRWLGAYICRAGSRTQDVVFGVALIPTRPVIVFLISPVGAKPPGFKGWSQHLDGGGCDEDWETALGSGATSRVAAVAWPARRGAAGEPAAVLGGDRGGAVERGRGDRGRRVTRGGGSLVPGGGRDVTQVAGALREATLRAVSGVR